MDAVRSVYSGVLWEEVSEYSGVYMIPVYEFTGNCRNRDKVTRLQLRNKKKKEQSATMPAVLLKWVTIPLMGYHTLRCATRKIFNPPPITTMFAVPTVTTSPSKSLYSKN